MDQRIDDVVPAWLSWAVKAVAGVVRDRTEDRNVAQGKRGERRAHLAFWLLLPGSWVVLRDVVLEPEPGEFAEIDHLLIGNQGLAGGVAVPPRPVAA